MKPMNETKRYILGAHNAATGAKGRRWWHRLMIPFARCQKKRLRELWAVGVRCFDLRVRLNGKGEWIVCHGLFETAVPAEQVLDYLAFEELRSSERVYVRLILETRRADIAQEVRFARFCQDLERDMLGITFFEGRRKFDWQQLYRFKYQPKVWQPVSSMAADARWYEKALPRAYAHRMNARNMDAAADCDIALFDFL